MVFVGGINLTVHEKGLKLEGFLSINVSVKQNPFCVLMSKSDTICKMCYAKRMEKVYPRLSNALKRNYDTLSTTLLKTEDIEDIARYVITHSIGLRFNSLGELINECHAHNLNLIAMAVRKLNPSFPIAIWSKRPDLVKNCSSDYMNIIFSQPIIDEVMDHIPNGFSGVFSVVTYDHSKKKNIPLNCEGMCKKCMMCYKPGNNNFSVTELLKVDQMRVKRGWVN